MAITAITATSTAGVNEIRRMNSNKLNGGSLTAITFKALVALDSTEDADIYTATTKTYGLAVNHIEKDSKYLFIIRNVGVSADKTVYIKAGDYDGYGAVNDLSITATKAATATIVSEAIGVQTVYVDTGICLDSAKYMQVNVTRNGQVIFLSSSADVQVAVIRLP